MLFGVLLLSGKEKMKSKQTNKQNGETLPAKESSLCRLLLFD